MTEPTTEAGRTLLDAIAPLGSYGDSAEEYEWEGDEIRWRAKYAERIVAIEQQAAAEQKRLDNLELFRKGVETGEAYERVIEAAKQQAVAAAQRLVCNQCGGIGTLRLHTEATGHTDFSPMIEPATDAGRALLDEQAPITLGEANDREWAAREALATTLVAIEQQAYERGKRDAYASPEAERALAEALMGGMNHHPRCNSQDGKKKCDCYMRVEVPKSQQRARATLAALRESVTDTEARAGFGSIPDLTGGLDPVEFVRRQRDDDCQTQDEETTFPIGERR